MRRDCCDMRGMLSFLILFFLSKKQMYGQEIADELEKRKGARPSPGTIYPALKSLKESKFVKEKREGTFIIYKITPLGKKALEQSKEQFCRIFLDVFED